MNNSITLALDVLIKERDYDGIKALIISKLPLIVAALAIIAVGFWIANLLGRLTVRAMRSKGVDSSVHNFIRTIITLLLKLLVVITALSAIGVNINSFVAAIGAAGLTLGLGLQESISQFASGVTILINKPFKSGDFIELENVSGKVLEIRLMYTTLITLDNKRVIVPNSHITSSNLINYNAEKRRRLDLEYSVSYDSDINKVKDVLSKVAGSSCLILTDPAPVIAVKQHDSSAIIVTCYVWCNSNDYWNAFYYMQEEVKLAFDKEGITIPFNQMDLHITKE